MQNRQGSILLWFLRPGLGFYYYIHVYIHCCMLAFAWLFCFLRVWFRYSGARLGMAFQGLGLVWLGPAWFLGAWFGPALLSKVLFGFISTGLVWGVRFCLWELYVFVF